MQHFRANHFAAFHFAANQLRGLAQEIIAWGKTGGIGKHKWKKSHLAEVKESIKAILAEPASIDVEIKEALKEYVKPEQKFTPINIDVNRLLEDTSIVQMLLVRHREIQRQIEQEDEEILLMLI